MLSARVTTSSICPVRMLTWDMSERSQPVAAHRAVSSGGNGHPPFARYRPFINARMERPDPTATGGSGKLPRFRRVGPCVCMPVEYPRPARCLAPPAPTPAQDVSDRSFGASTFAKPKPSCATAGLHGATGSRRLDHPELTRVTKDDLARVFGCMAGGPVRPAGSLSDSAVLGQASWSLGSER